MPTISVCMIVKNEEKYLNQCLNSVKSFADEIIVVDTGSTDKTKDIAKEFTDKIFIFQWIDDFSAARNFALEKARKEWVFIIDADEFVNQNPKDILGQYKENKNALAFLCMQRNYTNNIHLPGFKSLNYIKEATPNNIADQFKGYTDRSYVKLFKRIPQLKFKYLVHEQLSGIVNTEEQIIKTNYIIHHLGFDALFNKSKNEYYFKLAEKQYLLNPDDDALLYNAAVAYADNNDLLKATELLSKLYSRNKEFQNVIRMLSDFLLKLGRIHDSQELIKNHIGYLENNSAKDTSEISYLYYILGLTYMHIHNYINAMPYFEKSNLLKENADAYNALAMIKVLNKQYLEAHSILKKAYVLDPYNSSINTNMAKLNLIIQKNG